MNNNDGVKLEGTLLGAAGAALWWWNQDSQDRDERLRNAQLDTRQLSNRLNTVLFSADWIRLMSPAVRDAIIGLAAATPTSAPAQTVPPIGSAVIRADLTGGANIPSLSFPLAVGNFDAAGRTAVPGELATAFYALTYPEDRAFLQGLTQSKAPTPDALLNLFWAAQGLSWNASTLRLSQAQWQTLWAALFAFAGAAVPTPGPAQPSAVDAHLDPAKQPTAVAVTAQNITPLNTASPGPVVTYNNPQTDSAQRWRLQANAAGNAAFDRLARISFKTEYIMRGPGNTLSTFQPAVSTNRPAQVYADNITSTGFDLIANQTIGAGTYVDVYVNVNPGVASSLLAGGA